MQLLIIAAIGLAAGWLAGFLMKGRDYGVFGNLVLGLIGSFVGGGVLHMIGTRAPGGWFAHGVVALLGAMLVLGIARRLRPVSRGARKVLGEVGGVADLEAQFKKLSGLERRILQHVRGHGAVPRDPNAAFEEQMTFGQRVADQVATFGGSWRFIGLFVLFMLVWMSVNSSIRKPVDPYPFILLNLMLSCLAALQAPVIMMSQNRQAAKDRLMASNDYEVNLRTETDLAKLHVRFDELREQQWVELVEMQRRQIELLERLLRERATDGGGGA